MICCAFIFICLEVFSNFFILQLIGCLNVCVSLFLLWLISSFVPLWLNKIQCRILVYLNLWRLFKFMNVCGLTYTLSWRMILVHLRKICILLLFISIYAEYLYMSNRFTVLLISHFLINHCVFGLSITERGVLKSPNIIVELSIYPFNSIWFSLHIYFVILKFR